MRALGLSLVLTLAGLAAAEEPPTAPWVDRLEPFGGAQGETVEVRIVGERLAETAGIEFDAPSLEWLETLSVEPQLVLGQIRISPDAALGPHRVRLRAANGSSNSRLFYVDALPSRRESEPNDTAEEAQPISLEPQVLHGALPELVDRDHYRFEARAGERWVFDLRSIEYGGFLEAELALLDGEGRRVDFNDDRDDYLETPTLEHVFDDDGVYSLRVDQYRGPQRVVCAGNCGYMLRISQTPIIQALQPLGARRGSPVAVSVRGRGLGDVRAAWLAPARNAEHYRLTFPYTIPVLAGPEPDPAWKIHRKILKASDREATVEFSIPADAPAGLWRLWVESAGGPADGVSFEVGELPELSEREAREQALELEPRVVNGSLDRAEEEDVFLLRLPAGRPLHVAVLAVQLGLPFLDPVLELFDSDGRLVAEHDDLMTGQGTVIGNPDSSLYFTPEADGEFRLHVRDRIGRGGPSYVYRLHLAEEAPGFRLLTDAENPLVARGGESELGVLLIRDPGFEQAVEVWVEEVPAGLTVSGGQFRADQFFGPSADGDNVIIPEVFLKVQAAPDLEPGERPLRIFGKSADGRTVEAFATLWIGPPRKRNDVRRPLPEVRVTVVEPEQPTPAEQRQATSGSR